MRAYDIEHFFILNHVGERMDIGLETMVSRLWQEIKLQRPDVVVVHIGMAYHLERKQYLDAVNQLVKAFPSVLFIADKYIPMKTNSRVRGWATTLKWIT